MIKPDGAGEQRSREVKGVATDDGAGGLDGWVVLVLLVLSCVGSYLASIRAHLIIVPLVPLGLVEAHLRLSDAGSGSGKCGAEGSPRRLAPRGVLPCLPSIDLLIDLQSSSSFIDNELHVTAHHLFPPTAHNSTSDEPKIRSQYTQSSS